jgi:hypothetical protein
MKVTPKDFKQKQNAVHCILDHLSFFSKTMQLTCGTASMYSLQCSIFSLSLYRSSTELQRIKSRLFAEKFLTFVSYTSAGFDEHAIAVKSIGRITEFTQGQERSGFWDAIGGRGGYLSQGLSASKKPTRMFHCSEGTGVFGVNEVDSPTAADFISGTQLI